LASLHGNFREINNQWIKNLYIFFLNLICYNINPQPTIINSYTQYLNSEVFIESIICCSSSLSSLNYSLSYESYFSESYSKSYFSESYFSYSDSYYYSESYNYSDSYYYYSDSYYLSSSYNYSESSFTSKFSKESYEAALSASYSWIIDIPFAADSSFGYYVIMKLLSSSSSYCC